MKPKILVFAVLLLAALGLALTFFKQNNTVSQPAPAAPTPPLNSSTVIVTSPSPDSLIQSPLTVTGSVPAGWMFEGSFPVKLLDVDRREIARTAAHETVPGSWTSGGEVEFSAELTFTPVPGTGYLVLEKDNPSGLPENAAAFELPVKMLR